MTRRISSMRSAVALAAFGAASGVAHAQDAAAPTPPKAAVKEPAAPPAKEPTKDPEKKPELDSAVDELVGVNEIVVTGDRDLPSVPLNWAGGRTVLGPDDTQFSGQNSLQEMLQRVPGVHIEYDSGTTENKPNIGIRGIRPEASSESTLLVDGIPVVHGPYADSGGRMFPFVMERAWAVDVLRSGFATRYGPNNVVGVVNFITPPIPHEPLIQERMKFGSDDLQSFYTLAGGTYGDFGILIEDVHKSGDGYRDNGQFDIVNQGVKFSWQTSATSKLIIQYDQYDADGGEAGGLNDAEYEEDPYQTNIPFDYWEGEAQRGNARWIYEPDKDTRLEILAFGYGQLGNRHSGVPARAGFNPTSFTDSLRRSTVCAVQPTLAKAFKIGAVDNRLTVGAKIERDLVRQWTDRLLLSNGNSKYTANREFETESVAMFAEDTVTWGPVSVTGGIRSEHVDIDARDVLTGFAVQEDLTEVMPAISGAYEPTEGVAVFVSKYSGFRGRLAEMVRPDPNYEGIELETSESWDAGARASLGEGALDAEVTYFNIDFENRYELDPDDPDHFINVGAQRMKGVEIGLRSKFGEVVEAADGFDAYFTATVVRTEKLSGLFAGNELGDAPHERFAWGVGYRHPVGVRAGIDGIYVGDCFGDASNVTTPTADGTGGSVPSYTTWSARVAFDTTLDKAEKWRAGVEVGMNNLFDADGFSRFGSRGIVAIPPRSVYVGFNISVEF